jgi:hypothetical protein
LWQADCRIRKERLVQLWDVGGVNLIICQRVNPRPISLR